ncbi:MAG TPA: glycosyltransferase family 9 protein [Steroidobacteraceae bacterium]|nr:glycosyltransferase family 9 protein [Steroidobacteraceae bacterium]
MTAAGTTTDRPLVVRCGAFGDMVLLTALIRELSARWLRPVDLVTSGPWSRPLLDGQPGVGEIQCIRSRKMPYWLAADQRRLVRRLRARGAGAVWYCDASDAARTLLSRAGIDAAHIVDVKDHPLKDGEHALEQWRRLARITPACWAERTPPGTFTTIAGCSLEVGAGARADLEVWLRRRGLAGAPLVLIQAGNKRTMRRGLRRLAVNQKYWPNERWAEVIRQVHEDRPRHRIVLLGTAAEYALNQEVAALANIDCLHNAADDLPIPRLTALLQRADALITVDSGPAHAAAAVGCPQVVLFGKALPSLYRPWGAAGAPVQLLCGQVDGAASMLGIEAGEVVDAWRRIAAALN